MQKIITSYETFNKSLGVTSSTELHKLFNDLTLHQINSRSIFEELIQKSDLRDRLKHHTLETLNLKLTTAAKVENSLRLLSNVDEDVSNKTIRSLEKIHQMIPYTEHYNKIEFEIGLRGLLEKGPKLQSMFDTGFIQLTTNVSYTQLTDVHELTEKFGEFFIKHIKEPIEIINVLIKHFAMAEFICCVSFQAHLVPIIGSVLFFKFALPLLSPGNLIEFLMQTKLYIKAFYEACFPQIFKPSLEHINSASKTVETFKKTLEVKAIENDSSNNSKKQNGVVWGYEKAPWLRNILLSGVGFFVISSLYPKVVVTANKYFNLLFTTQSKPRMFGSSIRFNIGEVLRGFFNIK